MQNGRQNSKDGRLVICAEVKDFHGRKQTLEVLCIVLPFYPTIPSLCGEREELQCEVKNELYPDLRSLLGAVRFKKTDNQTALSSTWLR